jgi:hypothetical protein
MDVTTRKEVKMDGYTEARKIDGILSDLLEVHPLEKEENLKEWQKLLRTVGSTLALIGQDIEDKRGEKT